MPSNATRCVTLRPGNCSGAALSCSSPTLPVNPPAYVATAWAMWPLRTAMQLLASTARPSATSPRETLNVATTAICAVYDDSTAACLPAGCLELALPRVGWWNRIAAQCLPPPQPAARAVSVFFVSLGPEKSSWQLTILILETLLEAKPPDLPAPRAPALDQQKVRRRNHCETIFHVRLVNGLKCGDQGSLESGMLANPREALPALAARRPPQVHVEKVGFRHAWNSSRRPKKQSCDC